MRAFFKQIIKSVFGSFGLEIQKKRAKQTDPLVRRMFSIRTSMEQVLDHFVTMDFFPATVFDVGVAEGTPALYTRFPDATHILIEPLEEFEPSLKDICNRYNAEYVLAAAGDRPGWMEIGISDNLIASSLLRSYGNTRKIPVVTLDNVCKERHLKGPYVVKADVQGAELHVVAAGQRAVYHSCEGGRGASAGMQSALSQLLAQLVAQRQMAGILVQGIRTLYPAAAHTH